MSGCAKKSKSERLAILALLFAAAGFAGAAYGAPQTVQSAEAAEPAQDQPAGDQSSGETAAMPPKPKPVQRAAGRVRAGGSLQHRVDVLSNALQLDARQRSQLLIILESQRQAVNKIWNDPALLPAERTPATHALQERTANQIRGILSEEQKQRYNPPKAQGVSPPSPNVAEWMERQAQARPPQ